MKFLAETVSRHPIRSDWNVIRPVWHLEPARYSIIIVALLID